MNTLIKTNNTHTSIDEEMILIEDIANKNFDQINVVYSSDDKRRIGKGCVVISINDGTIDDAYTNICSTLNGIKKSRDETVLWKLDILPIFDLLDTKEKIEINELIYETGKTHIFITNERYIDDHEIIHSSCLGISNIKEISGS
ncbi:hypothetical protein A3715_11460 [Oleiphilus sp. HI0009]|nr:hypothetical protein A3715_11460 [Oleiphilus sp. HI0009]